ncbi:MAG: large repetitive protein, partial [Actinomycetota bacterium]|nr:large repetitive protein [Actinomycetota bacterium]
MLQARTLSRVGLVVAVAAALTSVGGASAFAAPKKRTPTPVITSKPDATTKTRTATFEFSDSAAGSIFSCSRDGGAWSSCTSPVTYTGLSEAQHTFAVRATAPGMRRSGNATATWVVDVTNPAAPTVSQPTTPTNQAAVSISFSSASTDVASYLCSLDGGVAAACTSPASVDPLVDGAHTYTVQAVDLVGNLSTATSVSWVRDTTTPTPLVSGPASATTDTSATFDFSSSEPGVTFSCSLDGALGSVCAPGQQYSSLGLGAHTFAVQAADSAGNTATSATYSWTVNATQSVSLGWSDAGTLPASDTNVTAAHFAFDHSGDTTLVCRLDGVDLGSCTSPADVSGLADGDHVFSVVADEGLGSAVTLSRTWTVDTVAPEAPYVAGPSGLVATDAADLMVLPVSPSTVTCSADSLDVACPGPVSLTGLAQGGHSFLAVATDTAGNTAQTVKSWSVDTVRPTASVHRPSSLVGPARVDFSENVKVGSGTLSLHTAAGTLLAVKVACSDATSSKVACGSNQVRSATLTPKARLVPGEHYRVLVDPAGGSSINDVAGNAAVAKVGSFRGLRNLTEASPALVNAWGTVQSTSAYGKSYAVERLHGASVSWSFRGTNLTWLTVTGKAYGRAKLYVDGVRKMSVSNYASTTHFKVARTVRGLSSGAHTVRILALGRKGSTHGTDTRVAVDAFRVGATLWTTPTLTGAFGGVKASGAWNGRYVHTDRRGASVKLIFRGTSVRWVT